MTSRKKRIPVKSIKEINALIPEPAAYKNPVDGADCLYVKVAPNGTKKFVTAVTVSKRIQLPVGQSRQKSLTHGLVSQFTLPEIKRLHTEAYAKLKRGEDIREEMIKHESDLERINVLSQPITQLGIDRLERRLARDEIKSGYNDRLYIRKVEAVIGDTSFLEFGQRHADALAKAYPVTSESWTTADKVKKLITKVYNDLSSDTKIELKKDIPHYLEKAFGRIKQRKRGDQVIEPEDISEMWFKMLSADVNPLFKDAFVFMLLTAERRSAALEVKLSQIEFENKAPQWLPLRSKRDQSGEGINLFHPLGMLALLLNRLINQAEDAGSEYLFPSQKGSGRLTDIRPLVDAIGGIGPMDIRTTPHNLRRTTANLGRVVLGSTQLAEEHILHYRSHMTGSTENYLSQSAKTFAKTRSSTFKSVYSYLDDLILSSGNHMYLATGWEDAEFVDEIQTQNPDREICRDFISVGGRLLHFSNQDSPEQIGSFDDREDFFENAYIWSPVASFCAGTNKYASLKSRPLLQEAITLGWVNYGEPMPRNLDAEID